MASRLPRPLSRALDTLRRDLDAATAAVRGTAPAPYATRDGSGWPQPRRYWLQSGSRPLHHVLVSFGAGLQAHAAIAAAALETPKDRVTVIHAGEDPGGRLGGLSGPRLTACRMAPDGLFATVRDLCIIDGVATRWYLCGPSADVDPLAAWLPTIQVDPDRILVDRLDGPPPAAAPTQAWPVTLRTSRGSRELVVPPGHTILDAAKSAGINLPSSCVMGGCGACRQRVVSGTVVVPLRTCLTTAEKAAGWTLLCVGRPTGPVTLEIG